MKAAVSIRRRVSKLSLLALIVLAVFSFGGSGYASAPAHYVTQEDARSSNSLGNLLKPDGSFKIVPGFTGSLDPSGWRLTLGENSEPRFVREDVEAELAYAPSAPGDEYWDPRFGLPGVSWTVTAIAVSSSDVYVGGGFTVAGDVEANYIARWDGSRWHSLGSGVMDDDDTTRVLTIVVRGPDVYVGGDFRTAGGVTAEGLARWDGFAWHSIGGGVLGTERNGIVYDLAFIGSDLYVGGTFQSAGGTLVNNIAKWDGTQWHPLGSGVDSLVSALGVSGTDLFAGGYFVIAGGISANGVAKWDGTQWTALSSNGQNGVDGTVYSLHVGSNGIYVGGFFDMAGGVIARNIARWDGGQWFSLGTDSQNGTNGGVYAIATRGEEVFVGGTLIMAGNLTVTGLARWDGVRWSDVGGGVQLYGLPLVEAITLGDNSLYVGGAFAIAGNITSGVNASRIAKWDGSQWSAFTGGTTDGANSWVKDIEMYGSFVLASGIFSRVGEVNSHYMAAWDGDRWNSFGNIYSGIGPAPGIEAIATNGDDVYVGGNFATIGGVGANNIARWDGTSWNPLGSGPNNGVGGGLNTIAISGTNVYVGGVIFLAGIPDALGAAIWDGTRWFPMSQNLTGTVHAFAIRDGEIFAGGDFDLGGIPHNVAQWDGNSWLPLGAGTNNTVRALAADDTYLYAGGEFTTAGTVSASRIARWDRSQWSALGGGVSACRRQSPPCVTVVNTISISGPNAYVGGDFTLAGAISANNIARWNGLEWSNLGRGTDRPVLTLATVGNDVYAGGSFTAAGGKFSSHFGRWSNSCLLYFSDVPYNSTFYPYVRCLACRGILSGYSDGTFRPNNGITRGQLAKVVSNSAGLSDPPGEQRFEDLPQGHTFYEWVQRLSGRGYIGGYPCGSVGEPCGPQNRPYFRPQNGATRGQIAKIVSNAAQINDPPGEPIFEDVPQGSPFYDWVQRLAQRGVMSGYPCGGLGEPCGPQNLPYFRPNRDATRGQLAKIAANTFFPACDTPSIR